ncbi:hypothetical protein [Streptomyces sp. NPDC001508]|uniref:hypothetical protein n=1 Tax=Streptomyces sp. NPDC001508 TaxID=3154656 RepID=UPI00331CF27B
MFLADGRMCKPVTGIDDHSRFIVISRVVAEPSGRAACTAFTEAMTSPQTGADAIPWIASGAGLLVAAGVLTLIAAAVIRRASPSRTTTASHSTMARDIVPGPAHVYRPPEECSLVINPPPLRPSPATWASHRPTPP